MSDVKQIKNNSCSAILLAYAAVAIGLAAAALLIFKDAQGSSFFIRSEFFFTRLIWAETLVAVGFLGGLLVPFLNLREKGRHIGGGHLVISHHIVVAAIVSLAFLAASIFIPADAYRETYLRFHVCIQIIVAAAAVVKIAVVWFSISAHQDGVVSLPADVEKPAALAVMLKISGQDGQLNDVQRKAVKKVQESIKYSIPEYGKIAELPEYLTLADDVKKLVSDITENDLTDFDNEIKTIEKTIAAIVCKIKN